MGVILGHCGPIEGTKHLDTLDSAMRLMMDQSEGSRRRYVRAYLKQQDLISFEHRELDEWREDA